MPAHVDYVACPARRARAKMTTSHDGQGPQQSLPCWVYAHCSCWHVVLGCNSSAHSSVYELSRHDQDSTGRWCRFASTRSSGTCSQSIGLRYGWLLSEISKQWDYLLATFVITDASSLCKWVQWASELKQSRAFACSGPLLRHRKAASLQNNIALWHCTYLFDNAPSQTVRQACFFKHVHNMRQQCLSQLCTA